MFKVGDEVEVINKQEIWPGMIGHIVKLGEVDNFPIKVQSITAVGQWGHYKEEDIKFIKETKVDIRERIEALTGWDKSADDIIEELKNQCAVVTLYIKIYSNKNLSNGGVEIKLGDAQEFPLTKIFTFENQCEKLEAFKKALLWLLDKSGLEKKEVDNLKIKELENRMAEIQKEIENLKR